MKNAKILMLLVIAGFSLLCVRSARAANYVIDMYYFKPPSTFYVYIPATLTVAKGDTVTWSNADQFVYSHTTTSGASFPNSSGLWDSGTLNNGQTYTLDTSTISAGTYPYFCKIDYNTSPAMVGTLIITNPPSAPTISITNPVSGTVFAAPANVTIQAAVTNGSGSVTNVQFLVGTRVLTNKTTAPYSATTNNLPAGSYTLTAIAKDNSGITATNSVTISVVTPVTVSLTNLVVISGTNFQFSYLVNTGLNYVVQLSTNLASANWIPLVTNMAASNPAVFVDPRATNKSAFYRVGRLPNP